MPSDPFLLVGLGIVALFVLAGLVLVVIAPFWAYHYVAARERQRSQARRQWLWETVGMELFAAWLIGEALAFAALLLSQDIVFRHSIGVADLVLTVVLAVAIPFRAYQSASSRVTQSRETVRQWIIDAAKGELLALGVAAVAALVLWPGAWWPYAVLWLIFFVGVKPSIAKFAAQVRYAFVGSFHGESRQYLAQHGQDSETERRMQRRMHGGQSDTDADEGEGGNETR